MRRLAIIGLSLLAGCSSTSAPHQPPLTKQILNGTASPSECRDRTDQTLILRRAYALCALGDLDGARQLVVASKE